MDTTQSSIKKVELEMLQSQKNSSTYNPHRANYESQRKSVDSYVPSKNNKKVAGNHEVKLIKHPLGIIETRKLLSLTRFGKH